MKSGICVPGCASTGRGGKEEGEEEEEKKTYHNKRKWTPSLPFEIGSRILPNYIPRRR
jgi:hypothetical protein